jgi:hypothetical protein
MHNRLWVGIVDMLGVVWLGKRMKLTGFVDLASSPKATADPDLAAERLGPPVRGDGA